MKKLLVITAPLILVITLAICYHTYAVTLEVSVTAYDIQATNSTYGAGAAYANGLDTHLAETKVTFRKQNGEWKTVHDKLGPTEGGAWAYSCKVSPLGTPTKVYARAEASVDNGGTVSDDDETQIHM